MPEAPEAPVLTATLGTFIWALCQPRDCRPCHPAPARSPLAANGSAAARDLSTAASELERRCQLARPPAQPHMTHCTASLQRSAQLLPYASYTRMAVRAIVSPALREVSGDPDSAPSSLALHR